MVLQSIISSKFIRIEFRRCLSSLQHLFDEISSDMPVMPINLTRRSYSVTAVSVYNSFRTLNYFPVRCSVM